MECRINAEDPSNGFRPAAGKITNLHFPGGHGVRIGQPRVQRLYRTAKLRLDDRETDCERQSREEVLTRMKRALQEFVIEGIKTTIPFHIKLMDDPGFKSGNFTTKYLESFDFTTL